MSSRVANAARLAVPSGGAVLLRLAQMCVIAAGSAVSPHEIRASLLATFGVVSAVGVFSDTGAITYLLTRKKADLSRRMVARSFSVQLCTSLVGGLAGTLFCVLVLPWPTWSQGVLLAVGPISAQMVESAVRVLRAPVLVRHADARFGVIDVMIAVGKVLVVGACLIVWSPLVLLGLVVPSLVVLAWVAHREGRNLPDRADSPRVRDIVAYGLAGASSGLYSQVPYLVCAAVAPVSVTGSLALALRVVQPLEVVPGVMGQQLLTRMKDGRAVFLVWTVFVGLGALSATLVVVSRPLIEILFSYRFTPVVVLYVIALSVPVKFGNYALTAGVIGAGRLGAKIGTSLAVGAVTVVLTVLAAAHIGALGAASALVVGELLLTGGLSAVLVRSAMSARARRSPWSPRRT
jgi:hypothetical protein